MSIQKISVITVCLNARDSIRLTMESVRCQSFGEIEHVIIDGGSTDGTQEIALEYEPGHFVSEPDKGVYDAMEKGGRAATGDILIFLNAGDTFYDDETCEAVAEFFDVTEADIVFGNLMPVYLRPTDSHDHGAFTPGQLLDLGYMRNRRQLYDESIHHQATFYRRWIFDRCRFECPRPEATGEYNLLLCAVMKEGAAVKHLPRPVSRFVLGGISTRDFAKEWKGYTAARDALRRLYFPAGKSVPLDDASEFIDPRFPVGAPAEPPAPTSGRRHRLKQWIKASPFFRAYDRLAFGLTSRISNTIGERIEATAERQAQRVYNDVRYMVEANLLSHLTEVVNEQRAYAAALAERIGRIDHVLAKSDRDGSRVAVAMEGLRASVANLARTADERNVGEERAVHQTLIALDQLDRRLDTVLINQANLRFTEQESGDFNDHGFRVFSQWDEDGLIHFLVSRIPGIDRRFVEFGVGDYSEANTRLLLERDNWVGLVMDSSAQAVESIRARAYAWRHSLTAVEAFVDRDNINQLLIDNGFTGEIGILSIDIDGVDYWIWAAVSAVSPQIVICEYNGAFGSESTVTVPYKADFDRGSEHPSMVYAGASLGALKSLGRTKGYTLVGTSCGGNNAFFVRDDLLAASGIEPAARPYTRPRFREARNPDGSLAFLDVADALKLVADRFVIDVESGLETRIADIPLSYE